MEKGNILLFNNTELIFSSYNKYGYRYNCVESVQKNVARCSNLCAAEEGVEVVQMVQTLLIAGGAKFCL
jgi:hypothetical protein